MNHDEVGRLLSDGSWHVLVLEFGATHGVMRLAAHRGDYPRHREVICGGTSYFRGALAGGPYRLAIHRETRADGTEITLQSDDGTFELRCRRILLGAGRG
ncbi:Hypothetical protein I5071_88680 [Sandaracinus amylolyticus]|nr:Hypothetical protein I5071_88680 [Sandaracinus amylolyticus]